ncbi:hypothetical protein IJ182_05005 [bacterium]|nr:hypothetical protein [bacterium]
MSELVSFFKDMFMINSSEGSPVGLCSFEHSEKTRKKTKVKKAQPKRELRLSELME